SRVEAEYNDKYIGHVVLVEGQEVKPAQDRRQFPDGNKPASELQMVRPCQDSRGCHHSKRSTKCTLHHTSTGGKYFERQPRSQEDDPRERCAREVEYDNFPFSDVMFENMSKEPKYSHAQQEFKDVRMNKLECENTYPPVRLKFADA